uniref:Spaetzle domain-containing protein n=1 Tax=Rhabditophanes sp. KR3021 TaxID=114890 RepID=A0AC35U7X8_9BILA
MKAGYMLRRLENLKSQAAGSPTQISSLIEIEESSGELVNKNSEKLLPINDNSINEENKELPTDSSESEIYDTNNVLADSVFENSNIISTIQSPETSKSHEDLSFSTTPTAATNVLRTEATHSTTTTTITTSSPSPTTATPNEEEIIEQVEQRSSSSHLSRSKTFNPKANHTKEECFRLTQSELINELKQKGTYNPDLMAWDASGLLRFLDRSISDQYERRKSSHPNSEQTVMRNVEALEKILLELDLKCDVRQPEVISKLQNLTIHPPRRSVASPTIRMNKEEIRSKRSASLMDTNILKAFNQSRLRDNFDPNYSKGQKIIGEVYIVPFGCDKRGEEEDGYLRLCGACQAIRKLPDNFFPPFINEVMCDEDKSCLYINDFPHGRCNQKYMNFVVLKNVGTDDCQIWQKFNLNVRVSCECFINETSFFAKYV